MSSTKSSGLKIPKGAVFFVDVDRVIFDVQAMKAEWKERFVKSFSHSLHGEFISFYDNMRNGWPGLFAELIEQFIVEQGHCDEVETIHKVFFGLNLKKYYLPGVREILAALDEHGTVVIFTQGFNDLQGAKLKALIDEKLIAESHVCISGHKVDIIDHCLNMYAREEGRPDKTVVAIDDHVTILEAFREHDPDTIGVLIYGKHPEQQELLGNAEFPQVVVPELRGLKSML